MVQVQVDAVLVAVDALQLVFLIHTGGLIRLTVRSAFMAPRTFSECEWSRLGGTAMVYIYICL